MSEPSPRREKNASVLQNVKAHLVTIYQPPVFPLFFPCFWRASIGLFVGEWPGGATGRRRGKGDRTRKIFRLRSGHGAAGRGAIPFFLASGGRRGKSDKSSKRQICQPGAFFGLGMGQRSRRAQKSPQRAATGFLCWRLGCLGRQSFVATVNRKGRPTSDGLKTVTRCPFISSAATFRLTHSNSSR